MTLLIQNASYTFLIRLNLTLSISLWKEFQLFLIRLNLTLSISLWKEFQLLQILKDLSHLLKINIRHSGCSSSYIGKTCCHFKTRIEEHIKKDSKPGIFKHLHSTTTCLDSYNSLCFKIIDKANSKSDLKIRKALY